MQHGVRFLQTSASARARFRQTFASSKKKLTIKDSPDERERSHDDGFDSPGIVLKGRGALDSSSHFHHQMSRFAKATQEPTIEQLEIASNSGWATKPLIDMEASEINKKAEYWKRKRIVERKHGFKLPSEDNMLTWAAKDQIWKLHQADPQFWSPQRIADSFPVSEEGARRLLKSLQRYVPRSDPAAIAARRETHDAEVRLRWLALTDPQPKTANVLSSYTQFLFATGRIKFIPLVDYGKPDWQKRQEIELPRTPSGPWGALAQAHLMDLGKLLPAPAAVNCVPKNLLTDKQASNSNNNRSLRLRNSGKTKGDQEKRMTYDTFIGNNV